LKLSAIAFDWLCMKRPQAPERHYSQRIGWLRAAVLGANDGIVSTASLVVGVAAAQSGRTAVLVAGIAGLVAGAMSMAAGEYVSVSSQADTEAADLARERRELSEFPESEREELRRIYVKRGLDDNLAAQVAEQLMARDALAAHARDELGLTEIHSARPVQAALASAGTFAVGAALPLVTAAVAPPPEIIFAVPICSLLFLAALGWLSARTGGAGQARAVLRVTFWGAFAMALTALVGRLFGAVV
jgi:vacuolar iron transporter family protein